MKPRNKIMSPAITPTRKSELLLPAKAVIIVVKRKMADRTPPIMRQARALFSNERHIISRSSVTCWASNSVLEMAESQSLSLPQQGQVVKLLNMTLVKQCGHSSIAMVQFTFGISAFKDIYRKILIFFSNSSLIKKANINIFHQKCDLFPTKAIVNMVFEIKGIHR